MKRFGIRSKLLLLALALIVLAVGVTYFAARSATEAGERRRIEQALNVRLSLATLRVKAAEGQVRSVHEWDVLAGEIGSAAQARVTLIAPGGELLGDSRVGEDQLALAGDHRDRPEVVRAFEGKVGIARRHSTTIGEDLYYVAGPIARGGVMDHPVAVVRLAVRTADLERAITSLRQMLALAALLAFVVTAVAAYFTIAYFSARIGVVTRAASLMAAGNLEVRANVGGSGELAELGAALDRLAKNLSSTLGALREERDRLHGILSSMEEGVLFLDEEGRVVLVNPALREMLLLQGNPAGKPLLEVVRHAELKEMIDAALDDELDEEGAEGSIQGEVRIFGLKPRQLLVRIQRLDDVAAGVVAVFLDVTETRRLENLRREFVANVSHELRTPVTSIRSAAETLETVVKVQPEMASKFVAIIDRNATRLHNLVEDVLDLSRIESRQFSMTLGPLSVPAVIQQAATLFESKSEARQVKIRIDLPPELPEVRADRRGLDHVISNLVDNAVKYAGVGKNVTLSARAVGSVVEIAVTDDGPGIESKHLPRLFERFYRVDAGRSRDLGGTGLGLAIVKHLAESMGGKVRVASELGKGTTFTVVLPAVAAGPRSRRPLPPDDDETTEDGAPVDASGSADASPAEADSDDARDKNA